MGALGKAKRREGREAFSADWRWADWAAKAGPLRVKPWSIRMLGGVEVEEKRWWRRVE
jgi:hypothetical protein